MSDEMNRDLCEELGDAMADKTECLMCAEKLRQEDDVYFRGCDDEQAHFQCDKCGYAWSNDFEYFDEEW